MDAYLNETVVILDTETTGLSLTDEIIEIACIDTEGKVLLNTFVNPTCPMTEGAQKVHGISPSNISSAPTMDTVAPMLLNVIRNRTVLSYNFEFDRRLIKQSLQAVGVQCGKDWKSLEGPLADHCIMQWYGKFYAGTSQKKISLSNALKQSKIQTGPQKHRALDDAQCALLLVKHMVYKGRPLVVAPTTYCPRCKNAVEPTHNFCGRCGYSLTGHPRVRVPPHTRG